MFFSFELILLYKLISMSNNKTFSKTYETLTGGQESEEYTTYFVNCEDIDIINPVPVTQPILDR